MNEFMRRYIVFVLLFAGGGLSLAQTTMPTTPPGTQPVTQQVSRLAPDDFDFKQLLGVPPAPGSAGEKAELDQLLKLQKERTPEEVRRCKDEVEVQPFAFAVILGKWFNAKDLPQTEKLLKMATKATKPILGAAKITFNRERPFKVDTDIHPCVEDEKSPSYPSGHATRGIVWATILAELMPQDKQDLMAYGREIGDDRALAGMHFPSDVIAGQRLGREIAQRLLADPDFQKQLAKAKAECAAHEPVEAK
ncbi:MAG TPA: phosphatase PAP2 family protein [Tepidisphaeraceae bacterium]|jgi:hypothetical protein|nr:phosphatase PAP2 family protein [Tepidisphaeraceae bacterium]